MEPAIRRVRPGVAPLLAALLLPALLVACGGLEPGTVRVSPLPPPDLDPVLGFGGRVRLEANPPGGVLEFRLEVLRGDRVVVTQALESLPFSAPGSVTLATEPAPQAGVLPTLRVEFQPEEGELVSFACELPPEFPLEGPGLLGPTLVMDPFETSRDENLALFGVRRGTSIRLGEPSGPFGPEEQVLRVLARIR